MILLLLERRLRLSLFIITDRRKVEDPFSPGRGRDHDVDPNLPLPGSIQLEEKNSLPAPESGAAFFDDERPR